MPLKEFLTKFHAGIRHDGEFSVVYAGPLTRPLFWRVNFLTKIQGWDLVRSLCFCLTAKSFQFVF